MRHEERVKELQHQLGALGLEPGLVDGRYGPITTDAVRRFQHAHDLPVDGVADPITLSALKASVKGSPFIVRTDRVKELQRQLHRLGLEPGMVDGRYGPLTTQAVKRFQKAHNLPADGIADPETLSQIKANTPTTPERELTQTRAIAKASTRDPSDPLGSRDHLGHEGGRETSRMRTFHVPPPDAEESTRPGQPFQIVQYLHACKQLLPVATTGTRSTPANDLAVDIYALIVYLHKNCNTRPVRGGRVRSSCRSPRSSFCTISSDPDARADAQGGRRARARLAAGREPTVDDLVRRGFVERNEDVEDRRMKRVRLTDGGPRGDPAAERGPLPAPRAVRRHPVDEEHARSPPRFPR